MWDNEKQIMTRCWNETDLLQWQLDNTAVPGPLGAAYWKAKQSTMYGIGFMLSLELKADQRRLHICIWSPVVTCVILSGTTHITVLYSDGASHWQPWQLQLVPKPHTQNSGTRRIFVQFFDVNICLHCVCVCVVRTSLPRLLPKSCEIPQTPGENWAEWRPCCDRAAAEEEGKKELGMTFTGAHRDPCTKQEITGAVRQSQQRRRRRAAPVEPLSVTLAKRDQEAASCFPSFLKFWSHLFASPPPSCFCGGVCDQSFEFSFPWRRVSWWPGFNRRMAGWCLMMIRGDVQMFDGVWFWLECFVQCHVTFHASLRWGFCKKGKPRKLYI